MLSASKVASQGSSRKVIYINWGNFPDIDVRPSLPALSACQCCVSLGFALAFHCVFGFIYQFEAGFRRVGF
jgi:hypothetical protein